MYVNIIGAGLAGCEAAWYLANKGIKVKLFEQKPIKRSEAHESELFSELVCSNSLRSNDILNACGLLKVEMEKLGSLIIESAKENEVPAGSALAVDREKFSLYITEKIKNHENITINYEEVTQIDTNNKTIIATGPLTEGNFASAIQDFLGEEYFHFFDAAAPIVDFSTIDMNIAYLKSRYDKGEAAYINCPMNREEYDKFYFELIQAECVELKGFENNVFEGCMPFEVMAKRGYQTLLFGPMKPVGLETPDGKKPYAVVQLRQDDAIASLYNIVGFQTHLKWGEQNRIIRMIPGLENVEITRYGVMHRNSYINSPKSLLPTYQSKINSNIFFAGQITGVEGYVESAASGINAAASLWKMINNQEMIPFPNTTAFGGLSSYITNASKVNFQPMNINFGIIKPLVKQVHKKERKQGLVDRAVQDFDSFILENNY